MTELCAGEARVEEKDLKRPNIQERVEKKR